MEHPTTPTTFTDAEQFLSLVRFDEAGLVPVIAQCHETSKIFMMAYADRAALLKTIETKYAHYYSRSRKSLWKKGETSGHLQIVTEILLDCDGDCVLIKIKQIGEIACHTKNSSCFFSSFVL